MLNVQSLVNGEYVLIFLWGKVNNPIVVSVIFSKLSTSRKKEEGGEREGGRERERERERERDSDYLNIEILCAVLVLASWKLCILSPVIVLYMYAVLYIRL